MLLFYTSNYNCSKSLFKVMFDCFKQAEQLISNFFPEKIAEMDNILQVRYDHVKIEGGFINMK